MSSPPTTLNLIPVKLEVRDEGDARNVVKTLEFHGAIIGSATSERDDHRGHPGTEYAPRNVKCSACRWLEVTIYLRRNGDPSTNDAPTYDYVIHTLGASDVPGEIDFVRLWETSSAFEVVELLTVRRNRAPGNTETFIPVQHARALAQAASIDDEIREAYVNRAVV